jgi:protein arginine kinase
MSKWYEQSGREGDVVISTRIRLARNLPEFPFPIRMSQPDRLKLTKKVVAAATDESAPIPGIHFIDVENLSKTEAVSLVERHLASPELISDCAGRGLLVNDDEFLSAMINEEDHLHLQCVLGGLDLQKAYQAVDSFDTMLDKALHFAFDKNLGYLTQNPVNLGTGMRASLMLHLPALKEEGSMLRISASLSKLGLVLRGIYGSGTEPKGAIYQLSNEVTLGLSEQEAIANLESIAMQLVVQERVARTELAQSLTIQDTVSRSLGILQSARVMTNDEFMHLISNVRFGISVNLVKDIGYDEINRLIIEMQPATLMLSVGKKLTASERHTLRAKKVSDVFHSIR